MGEYFEINCTSSESPALQNMHDTTWFRNVFVIKTTYMNSHKAWHTVNCACFVQFKEQLGSVTNPEQKKNEVWERVVKDVLRSLTLSCLKFLCSLLRLRHRKLMFYRSLSVSVAVESKWERKAESDVCQGQAKAAFSNLPSPTSRELHC